MTQKLYNEERDTDEYDNIVMKHMLAMTAEGLHSKAAIAVELAYRDWQIEQLREVLQGFIGITEDSKGVAGYHLNGAIADWDEFDEVGAAYKALEETK